MGSYSSEFVNAATRGLLPFDDRVDPADVHDVRNLLLGRQNATILRDLMLPVSGGVDEHRIIYIPSGRYLIGRPFMGAYDRTRRTGSLHEAASPLVGDEHLCDLLVPHNVTLKFASGAVLVPVSYTGDEAWKIRRERRTVVETSASGVTTTYGRLPESEERKVYIEFQGTIDALVQPIFDVFVEGDIDSMPVTGAGRVFFTRDFVREVYPEWWSAVPLENEGLDWTDPLSDGDAARVKRTTAALQATIDAACNHRIKLRRLNGATVGHRTTIPIVLINGYGIDRPLRIGASVRQAQSYDVPEVDFPFNASGMVIRGRGGPATRSFGAALIKAAPGFSPLPVTTLPVDATAPPEGFAAIAEVPSMLVVRVSAGITLENVVFDAAETAERCVTLSCAGGALDAAAAQGHGLRDCEFRHAQRTLLHVGGEFPPGFSIMNAMSASGSAVGEQITIPNLYFAGNHDLSSLRVVRCRFETAAPSEQPDRTGRKSFRPFIESLAMPAGLSDRWRFGVLFRAKEALGTVFDGCVFLGPANPMFVLLGGRVSLQECTFLTDEIVGSLVPAESWRSWNGTDVFIPAPLRERVVTNAAPSGLTPGSLLVRNIESRSRQFLNTYKQLADDPTASPAALPHGSGVLLANVHHRSAFDNRGRPAIYWGGPRDVGVPLVLMGCVLGEGNNSDGAVVVASGGTPRVFPSPVTDVGVRRLGGGRVFYPHPGMPIDLLNIQRVSDRSVA